MSHEMGKICAMLCPCERILQRSLIECLCREPESGTDILSESRCKDSSRESRGAKPLLQNITKRALAVVVFCYNHCGENVQPTFLKPPFLLRNI